MTSSISQINALMTATALPVAKSLNAASGSSTIIRLRTLDVLPFEGNPRQSTNERIAEIRESIRKQGLNNTIKVTQGGGRAHYITAAGGCSRLTALHQLASGFAAAGVPDEQIQADAKRFEFTDFIVHPYVSESDLLARHMSENTQRSDMTFWDTATGFAVMRRQMEQEQSRTFSHADYANALAAVGLKADKNNVALYAFTATHYQGLSPDHRNVLSRDDIRNGLRPGFYLLSGLWEKHGRTEFEWQYMQWVILSDPNPFSAAALQVAIQHLAAVELGYSDEAFASLLAAFKINRDAPLADLLGTSEPEPAWAGRELGIDVVSMQPLANEPDPQDAPEPEAPAANMPPIQLKPLKKAPVVPPVTAPVNSPATVEPVRTVLNESMPFQGFNEALEQFSELCGLDESLIRPSDDLPFGYEVVLPDSEYRVAMAMEDDGEEKLDGLTFLAVLSGQEIEEPIDAAVIRRVLLDSPLTDAATRLIIEMRGVE